MNARSVLITIVTKMHFASIILEVSLVNAKMDSKETENNAEVSFTFKKIYFLFTV